MPTISDLCAIALEGDSRKFGSLLKQAKRAQLNLESRALEESVINSMEPMDVIDTWITIQGEPTLDELENWRFTADRDRCVAALVIISTKIIKHFRTQSKTEQSRKIKALGTIIRNHDSMEAANFVMKHQEIWRY